MPEQSAAFAGALTVKPTRKLKQEACSLCGSPAGNSGTSQIEDGSVLRFCCPGCRQVYLILSGESGALPADFRETEIYRACVEARIIPGNEKSESSPPPTPGVPLLDLTFKAEGMWCPACAWLIGEVLKKIPGVFDPRVSFISDTVTLKYSPIRVAPKEIAARVEKLGYQARLSGEKAPRAAKGDLLLRLGVSSIFAMNAMMLSWAVYFGFVKELSPVAVSYFAYPLLALTAPVVFYGGAPIFRRAWAGIRLGYGSMDTLIALSTLAAFAYSVARMAQGSIHLYFDTAAMLVTVVLFGRYIEAHAKERVLGEARAGLEEVSLRKARLAGRGFEKWVAAEAVNPGDRFVVRGGERVPLDGRIVSGRGLLDLSVVTGEPEPVPRGNGEEAAAGSLLVDGELKILATAAARESSLQKITDLMEKSISLKTSGEQAVDAASRLFAPVIIAVTAGTAVVLWLSGTPLEEIILRSLTMLLISCPCALGIAVPIVRAAAIGLGRRKGILIKNPDALEKIPRLDTIVFDKTGTATEGKFVLLHVVCDEFNEREIISRVGAIEVESSHFLAREVLRRAHDLGLFLEKAPNSEELDGMGVTGVVKGDVVFAGNRRLISRIRAQIPQSLDAGASHDEDEGLTAVFFGWQEKVRGYLAFGDPLRQGMKELVHQLHSRGLKVILLSGDGMRTTAAAARSLGISDFYGQKVPEEKAGFIKSLKDEGRRVAMVGDGINDAGALAAADVSFAVGAGHDITNEAADLIIMGGKLTRIIETFDLAALSVRTTRQNLRFAFLYNVTAIPVAAAGLLNPLIAVLAMFMSSLTVIGNALRLSRTGITKETRETKQTRKTRPSGSKYEIGAF